jgi:SAM-dependent methyltransferase
MKCKLCGNEKLIKMQTINVDNIQVGYEINVSKYFMSNEFVEYKCSNCQINFFDNAIPGDSEFYDFLQEQPMYYETDKGEFRRAIELISKYSPSKLLEIGAGRGYFLEKIKDSYEVRASEYSKKSLNYLKSKNISLDKDNDLYDFIVSFQVFEHVDNLRDLLNFVDRKLEASGHLFITVPNNDSNYFQETFDILDYPPHHMYQFNEYALKYIAKEMNYELLEYWIEPMRIEHYSSIIRQRRKKIIHKFKFVSKVFSLIDYLLIPYNYDSKAIGHTHGILLQKRK